MSFPHKILGFKRGWKDLGQTGWISSIDPKSKMTIRTSYVHDYCNTITSIGKENGQLFKYCPRCLIKLE